MQEGCSPSPCCWEISRQPPGDYLSDHTKEDTGNFALGECVSEATYNQDQLETASQHQGLLSLNYVSVRHLHAFHLSRKSVKFSHCHEETSMDYYCQ